MGAWSSIQVVVEWAGWLAGWLVIRGSVGGLPTQQWKQPLLLEVVLSNTSKLSNMYLSRVGHQS